ncbi:MAG: prephenate dehydrogenase [Rickettsiales bacterium]
MRIALLGAGQLGGAFALALRTGEVHFTAYDSRPEHATSLHEKGAVDAVAETVADAVRHADIVMLAAPLRSYSALADAMAPALKPGTIVTDLGSVKSSMQQVGARLPTARIVPGHPIAGSEQSGPQAARGDLFRGKLCILTPDATTDAAALSAVETLWHIAGADILHMPASLHDQVYAYVSHLPHFIAFISAQYYFDIGAKLGEGDGALRQFLRIANSSARMWADIALVNREALLPAVATYLAVLEHFAAELRMDPDPTLGVTVKSTRSPDGLREPEAEGRTRGSDSGGGTPPPTASAKKLLPRLLASSLISSVSLFEKQAEFDLRGFSGGGLRDIVAPAMTPPEADMEAISNASAAMADHLDAMVMRLRAFERMVGSDDADALFAHLTHCAECAAQLAHKRQ